MFGRTLGGLAKTGALAGLASLFGTLKVGIGEFSQAAKVSAQTAAVLKSTGGAAKVSQKQIEDLSTALMKKSGIDDEAIQSGQNMLATFTKVANQTGKGNDIFKQATVAALDMSVAMGKDMTSSAMLVGKALNDPIKGMTALTKSGIQFTDAQKATVKSLVDSGNVMAAQKVILKELTTQFGGSAEALGKTLPGKLNILKESFSNLAGQGVGMLIPAVLRLGSVLQSVGRFVEEHRAGFVLLGKALVVAAGTWAVYNAAVAVGTARMAMASFAAKGLWVAIAAHPLALAAAAVAALAGGLFFLLGRESAAEKSARSLAAAQTAVANAHRDAASAARAQGDALLALLGANLSVKEAALGLREANARVAETLRASGRGSDEHTRALLDLQRAQLAVKQASIGQADAAARAVEAAKKTAQSIRDESTAVDANVKVLRLSQLGIMQRIAGSEKSAQSAKALAVAERGLAAASAEAAAKHRLNASQANQAAAAIRGTTPEASRLRAEFHALAKADIAAAKKQDEFAKVGRAAQVTAADVRAALKAADTPVDFSSFLSSIRALAPRAFAIASDLAARVRAALAKANADAHGSPSANDLLKASLDRMAVTTTTGLRMVAEAAGQGVTALQAQLDAISRRNAAQDLAWALQDAQRALAEARKKHEGVLAAERTFARARQAITVAGIEKRLAAEQRGLERLSTAFAAVRDRITRAFDAITGAFVSPAEGELGLIQERRRAEDQAQAVADAERELARARQEGDPVAIAAATRALTRAREDITIGSLEKTAAAERSAWERSRSDLREHLEASLATVTTGTQAILNLLATYGVSFADMGRLLGQQFVDGLNASIRGVAKATHRPVAPRIAPMSLPGFAAGGIVTRPTLAMIGEAGPEAIIPLSQSAGRGGGVTINFPNYVGDKHELVELLRTELIRAGRRMPGALGGLA